MLTRLKLQRGEGKLLVASPNIRTRERRDARAPYPPKFPLIASLEEPQVLSQESEFKEVQAPVSELESIAIMSSAGQTRGHS